MVYLVFHAEPQLWAWDCLMKCGELGVGRQVKREGEESRFHVTTEVVIFFPLENCFPEASPMLRPAYLGL